MEQALRINGNPHERISWEQRISRGNSGSGIRDVRSTGKLTLSITKGPHRHLRVEQIALGTDYEIVRD